MKVNKYVTLLAASALSVAVGQSVYADENTTTTPVVEATPTTQTQKEVGESKPTIQKLEADAKLLGESVEKGGALVNEATATVAEAEKELTTLTNQVAEQEKTVNELTATPKEELEARIDTAEETINQLEETISVKEQLASDLQKQQAEQLAQVEAAKANEQAAEALVIERTEEVAQAQDSLNDIAKPKTDAEIQALLDTANEDESLLNVAKEVLKTQQDDLAALKAGQAQLEEEKAIKESAVEGIEADILAKQAEIQAKQVDVEAAKEQVAQAQAAVEAMNVVTVSQDYVDALKKLKASRKGTEEYNEAVETLTALNAELRAQQQYKPNEAERKITLTDLNNLSEEVRTELSLFASGLINGIRTAFGTTQTIVTPSSVNMSDVVTDEYVEENWTFEDVKQTGHNMTALSDARIKTGVMLDENMNTWGAYVPALSLNKIKELVYLSIVDFMYNGKEWDHASSIAGLTPYNDVNYIGADLSTDEATRTTIHVNGLGSTNARNLPTTFDTSIIENPHDLAPRQAALASALDAQAEVNEVVGRMQATLDTLSSEKEFLEEGLVTINAELEAIKAQEKAVEEQAARVEALEANATSSKLAYDQAVEEKNHLSTIQGTLEDVLEEKQGLLVEAKEVLEEAKAQYEVDFAKLEVITNALTTTTAEIKLLKQEVSTQENIVARSRALIRQQEVAVSTLERLRRQRDDKSTDLIHHQTKLAEAKENLRQLRLEHEEALSLLDHYKKDFEKSESGPAPTPQAGVNGVGSGHTVQLLGNKLQKGSSNNPTQAEKVEAAYKEQLAKATTTEQALAQTPVQSAGITLPNAGDENSTSLVVTGILTLLGVAGFAYKKKRQDAYL